MGRFGGKRGQERRVDHMARPARSGVVRRRASALRGDNRNRSAGSVDPGVSTVDSSWDASSFKGLPADVKEALTSARQPAGMSRYLRPRVPGASVCFTLALSRRGSRVLVEEIAALRDAVRLTRAERPFRIDAWVVLPDHLHGVWTLPEGDADYSLRWKEIWTRFTKSVGRVGPRSASKIAKGEAGIWQQRFWGEVRPEIGLVDQFQHRTGEAPAAKPITSGMNAI